MNLEIKPLSQALLQDYLHFFDHMTFTENPHWSKCYCYSFHFTGPDERWNKKENRNAVIRMISDGSLKGYLAYSNSEPVGWCNANDRKNYQGLEKQYHLDSATVEKICSIVCFLISPNFRNHGIARQLLDRVITDYTMGDYAYCEAYPAKNTGSCEKNYKGPMRLYEQRGFQMVEEHDHFTVVRKSLD